MRGGVAVGALAALLVIAACNGTFRFDEPPLDGGADAGQVASGRACGADDDCSRLGLLCDTASGRCVACLADSDCAAPWAKCSPKLHVCVECLATSDCSRKQRCSEDTMTCLDTCAEGDEKCPTSGFVCNEGAQLCVECRSTEHCAGNPHGSHCDPDIGRCAECLGNAQCPVERPKCDRRRGTCAVCVTSTDCPGGMACDPTTSQCIAVQ